MAPSSTSWLKLSALWMAGLGAAMQFAKISVAFEHFLDLYQAEAGQMGLVLSLVGLGSILFGATAGILASRLGYRRVILFGLIAGAVISAFQAFLPPLSLLLASRLIEGLSHVMLVVAIPTLMLSMSAPRHRALVMGWWGSFFSAGFVFISLWGEPLLKFFGSSVFLLAHSFIMLILALLLMRWITPSPQHHREKLRSLDLFLANWRVYSSLITALPGLLFLFQGAMFVSLLTFLPSMARDAEELYWLAILLPLASIMGTNLAGYIAQYWISPLTLSILSFLGLCLSSVGLGLAYLNEVSILLPAFLLMIISGVVQGSAFALVPYLTEESLLQSRANGAIAQLANLGGTIFIPIFAFIFHHFGPVGFNGLVFVLALGGIAMGLFARYWLRQRVLFAKS